MLCQRVDLSLGIGFTENPNPNLSYNWRENAGLWTNGLGIHHIVLFKFWLGQTEEIPEPMTQPYLDTFTPNNFCHLLS